MSVARLGSACLVALLLFPLAANAATIIVDTTAAPAADGNCSLEEAVSASNNANSGPNADCAAGTGLGDVIQFGISGLGVHVITLAATVNVNVPMTIDGYTQTGASNASFPQTIEIQVTAGLLKNAFVVTADNVTIRGLSIVGSNIAISLGGSFGAVKGNFIGVNADGVTPNGNSTGVQIPSGTGNLVGGTTPSDRNVITANGEGVTVGAFATAANPTVVSGNYIGVNATGTGTGNSDSGVLVDTAVFLTVGGVTGTTPGGACTGACNVISENVGYGIQVNGPTASSITIQGNYIGVDPTGTVASGNGFNGVIFTNTVIGSSMQLGGTTANARNVISSNGGGGGPTPAGVFLNTSTAVTIQGNYVGLNAAGTAALANSGPGILVTNSPSNTIGGTTAGAGNVISGNTSDAIQFLPGSDGNIVQSNFIGTAANGTTAIANAGNAVTIISANNNIVGATTGGGAGANTLANSGNAVLVNGGTGNSVLNNILDPAAGFVAIGLGGNVVNPNDSCDGDAGSNNLQNFPVITAAGTNGVSTTIITTLNSTASQPFTIELYTDSTTFTPNGWTPIDAFTANTDGSCNATVTRTFASTPAHNFVAATATDAAGNTSALSGAVPLLQAPAVTMSFTPSPVNVNTPSLLTITIANSNAANALTVGFTDTYPGTLVNAGAASTTCAGGALTATIGGGSLALSGGNLPANSSCTVTVNVESASAGSFANSVVVGSAEAGPSLSAGATLVVNGPPSVSKNFTPGTIAIGQTSTLTITLVNTSGTPYTSAAFTDNYGGNVQNAAAPAASTTCGGTVTAAAGGSSVALSGGTIPAGGSCTVSVVVTSTIPGTYPNNIAAGAVTSSGPPNSAGASATLTVTATAPTVAKSFNPASVVVGATSTLTVTLTNGNATALTNVGFTDSYPAGLVNGTPSSASTTCGGGVTAGSGTGSLALSGGTIPANGSCTVTVLVTSSTANSYSNTIAAGAVTSDNAPANTAAGSATLTVTPLVAPTVAKSFSPTSILPTQTSTLTVTLTNPNAVALTSAAFTDTYPVGLVNAAVPNASTTCGGSVTAAAAGGSLALSGGTIPASGSCTVSVSVTSAVPNSYDNTIAAGAVTSNAPPNGTAVTATLTVSALAAPTVAKSFSPASVPVTGVSTLTITLSNSNAVALTGVGFTDSYPANLVNASSPAAATTCGGTLTATAGSGSAQLSGGTIPASGSCTVTLSVTSSLPNAYANTIPAGAVTSNGPPNNTAANDTLTVTASALTVAKSFSPAAVPPGSPSSLTITLSNSNPVAAASVAFTDTYPTGLVNAASPSASTTCGGTVTATAGGASVDLSGGTIPANGSCTVSVTVTSASSGSFLNTIPASAVTSTLGTNTAAASATLTVSALPTVAKSFAPASILPGGTSTLTITLTNPNAAAATSAAFTDTYPIGLVNAASPAAATTCGGTVTATAGGGSVALSGGTIPASGSCTVSVIVTGVAPNSYINSIAAGAVSSSAGANAVSASATLTVSALSAPTVAKTFTPASIVPGTNSTLTITLTNANAVAATSAAFTDTYPIGLVNVASPAASTTCGGTVTATAGGGSVALSGGTIPANGSCTVSVIVTSVAPNSYTNTIAAGAVTSTAPANTAAANGTLTVTPLAAMGVSLSFSPSTIFVNNSSMLTITLTNSNTQAINGVTFTNNYPAGMMNFTTPNGSTTCGGTVTATPGGTSLALNGGSIPPNGSCTVTVFVTSSSPGNYTDTIAAGAIASTNAGANAAASGALVVAGGVTGAPALPDWAPLFMALVLGMLGVVVLKRS